MGAGSLARRTSRCPADLGTAQRAAAGFSAVLALHTKCSGCTGTRRAARFTGLYGAAWQACDRAGGIHDGARLPRSARRWVQWIAVADRKAQFHSGISDDSPCLHFEPPKTALAGIAGRPVSIAALFAAEPVRTEVAHCTLCAGRAHRAALTGSRGFAAWADVRRSSRKLGPASLARGATGLRLVVAGAGRAFGRPCLGLLDRAAAIAYDARVRAARVERRRVADARGGAAVDEEGERTTRCDQGDQATRHAAEFVACRSRLVQ
jgi:hypothetical protein